MTANVYINEQHPYGPLFKAFIAQRDAIKRRDTRDIKKANDALVKVRHNLMKLPHV